MGLGSWIEEKFKEGVDAVTPDVTIGNPTAPVTNLVDGAVNLHTDITGSILGGFATTANQALNATGSVLSNPNAAPLLNAAGTAYGVPGLASLANAFGGGAGEPERTVQLPPASGNSSLLLMGGLGILILAMTFFIINRRKR